MKPEVFASQFLKALCLTFTLMHLLRLRAFIFLVKFKFLHHTLVSHTSLASVKFAIWEMKKNLDRFQFPIQKSNWDLPSLHYSLHKNKQIFRSMPESIPTRRRSFQEYGQNHGPELQSNPFCAHARKHLCQGVFRCILATLSEGLSVRWFVRPSVRWSLHPFVRPSDRPTVRPSAGP